MINKWLLVAFVGFTGGIAFRSFFDFGDTFVYFLTFLAVTFFILTVLSIRNRHYFVVAGIFIFALALGTIRFDIGDILPPLGEHIDTQIVLEGAVVREPDVREGHTKLTVRADAILPDRQILEKVNVLLVVDKYPEFQYGDVVRVSGILDEPENFAQDDSDRVFDYVGYLKKDNVFYQMFYPEVEKIGVGGGNIFAQKLFLIKNKLLKSVSLTLPEPHASLVGGVVFGAKQSLGEELLEAFRAVGIIHIVVLSGYNVTIVAEWIGRLASFAPRGIALGLSVFGIVGFALMTGAGATVVRASIMALLVLLARATGRLYAITTALLIAGIAMLVHNPKILIFDASFQLSFLATVGLIYLAPHMQGIFSFVPKKFGLREFATATIATQIFVLPLLLYMTGQFSIVAVVVNILILAFIPLTMLFGFLTGVFGIVHIILSLPFAYIAYALLSYELTIVDIFSRLPFASVSVPSFPVWVMVVVYALYGLALLYLVKKKPVQL
ncbi:hypothetical protein CL630_03065 [bacterium]|mgnify:CR=1 FL=1|nr:hypothetical protein [bacterium]|tara:strand:- start:23576 stop:25063 length:1488 start_codon:yes stop_codon:yes gene_type:complete